jgi:predicted nucleic acid-binding protein
MERVAIDTQILIWGVQAQANEGQDEMIGPAKAFLRHLQEEGTLIQIPSIVLSEYLVGTADSRRRQALDRFQRAYQILPHDALAAYHTAEVVRATKGEGIDADLRQRGVATRREIKADCMIVGTLIAHRTPLIYSNDEKTLHKIAEGFVEARRMPAIDEQGNLFGASV